MVAKHQEAKNIYNYQNYFKEQLTNDIILMCYLYTCPSPLNDWVKVSLGLVFLVPWTADKKPS